MISSLPPVQFVSKLKDFRLLVLVDSRFFTFREGASSWAAFLIQSSLSLSPLASLLFRLSKLLALEINTARPKQLRAIKSGPSSLTDMPLFSPNVRLFSLRQVRASLLPATNLHCVRARIHVSTTLVYAACKLKESRTHGNFQGCRPS